MMGVVCRLLVALCASLALMTAASPATASASSLKAIWGPSELPDGKSAFPLYKRLGVDVLEHQLSWRDVATARPANPQDPNDPAYRWPKALDLAVAEADRSGIRTALMVKQTPDWANRNRGPEWVPDNVGDYGDFLVAAAKRYRTVRHWMIWGEPTRGDSFEPMPPGQRRGPRAYAVLLDRAYAALKGVSRDNIVIGGMTYTVGVVGPSDFVRWMRLPNGKPPRLDWFGHNPFSVRFPRLAANPYRMSLRDMSDVDTLHAEVRRAYRGHRTPRLWLSEFTVSSDRDNRAFAFHVSRRGQAKWLAAAFQIAAGRSYIAGIGWYTLLDEPEHKKGLTSGLLTSSGKTKPAFYAYPRAR